MAQQAKKVTRLRGIEADRVDGVTDPANGFPVLMMKAVNAQGGIDEKPDIAGAKGVIVDLFKLIASEAAEGATGAFGEIHDIGMLCDAICALQCFLWNEQDGDEDDGEPIYKSLDQEKASSLADYVLKRKFSAEKRKELAASGDALPDGSYPIENSEDLHNAAILARSGHGDVAAAKKLIARKAKELKVPNPLAAQATKETNVPEDAVDGQDVTQDVTKDTETSAPNEAPVDSPEESEVVKEAIAKATEAQEAVIKGLRDELAVLKATPIPGGPALTAPAEARAESAKAERLAKAAEYRQTAERIQDRGLRKQYITKAEELEAA